MRVSRGVVIRKFGKVFAAVVLVAAGLGLFLVAGNFLFTIRAVEVVGVGVTVAIDEQRFVKNLLFFPSDALRVQLLREYPLLESVEIHKKYPHTLLVVAHKRPAVAAIANGNRTFLVSRDGTILGDADGRERIPVGYFQVRAYAPGERVSEKDAAAFIGFIAHLPDVSQVRDGTTHDAASIRVKLATMDIYVALDSDMAAKASTLQMLLAGFRIKGTLPAVIDLRFDKPIVTF